MSAQPTIVFVSHSSRDGETAHVFVQHLLNQTDLCPNVSVRFTSARQTDSPALLDPGTPIWKQLRADLEKTKCFIACLSEDFFKSSWCIAELTIFHELRQSSGRNASERRLILLIVDPSARNLTTNFLTQGLVSSVIWSAIDLKRLADLLKIWGIRKHTPNGTQLQKLRSEARAAVRSRTQAKKGYFTEIAQQNFGFPSSTNGPITCLVRRDEYEQISVNMARRARSELLWTLFKSPLLVADAFRQTDRLMPYDRHFRDFDPVNKVRLVIFEGIPMAQAYAECNVSYHKERFKKLGATDIKVTKDLLLERKRNFENSARANDGRLFFTTLKSLPRIFPPLTKPTFHA